MTITYSKNIAATDPMFCPNAGEVAAVTQIITVGTADLTQNTTFDICYVPPNCKVVGGYLAATDMDSAASPALTIIVGDSGDTDRFINAGTIGQAAMRMDFGNNATSAASLITHQSTVYTAPTKIYGTFTNAPGTAVAGTIAATVFYTMTEPPGTI